MKSHANRWTCRAKRRSSVRLPPQQGLLLPRYPLSEGDSCKPFQLCLDVFKPPPGALQIWEYFGGTVCVEQVA